MSLSTELRDAVRTDSLDLIEINLTKRPVAKRRDELDACLALAMPQGSLEMIERLIRLGARLSSVSLHSTIKREEPAIFAHLIESGWDINSTEFEASMLHITLEHETLLRWLLDHGADPNILSQRRGVGSCLISTTPLCEAAKYNHTTPLEILLSYGAKMDPEAIFYAIDGHRGEPNMGTATLKMLIEHGADVNYVSKRFVTPLYHAVRRNKMAKFKLLLEHGADPSVKYLNGTTTALSYAKAHGRTEFYNLMEAACCQKLP